jgi:acyl-CoA thioesterase I
MIPPLESEKSGVPRLPHRLARIGRTILLTLVIAASLLTFPSAIPWLVAFWLLCHTMLIFQDRTAWAPLVIGAAILIVKQVDWSSSLIAMAAVMLIVSIVGAFVTRANGSRRRNWLAWLGVVAAWTVWAGMTYEWRQATHAGQFAIKPGRPVACMGDSLTAFGYPEKLRQMISLPVVDLSCNGITTDDALLRLPALIAAKPQVVVIELGGHDFLRGHSRATTKENLEKIIAACRSVGAEIILLEIPRGFISDSFGDLERELARQNRLELVPDTAIRRLVLWSPSAPPGMWLGQESLLSDDGLHPNARGNVMLAKYVADALVRMYGSSVRSAGDFTHF